MITEQIVTYYLESLIFKVRVTNRVSKRIRNRLKITLIILVIMGLILESLYFFIKNDVFLFLPFIPIGVGYYLIYKLQKAVDAIRGIFLSVHNVTDFNTWIYTELKNEVIAREINCAKKIKRLQKNIKRRLKEMAGRSLLSNTPSWLYNSMTSAIISILLLNVKTINNVINKIIVVVLVFAAVTVIVHLNKKIPNLSLYFRNRYSTARDLKLLIRYLDDLPLEKEIK